MHYYGQWETDRVIESYFPEYQHSGLCIEVGAYDGIKGSNTKIFEDKGWLTVCIEPNPCIFHSLKKNRKGLCLNVACDNFFGHANLNIFTLKSGIESSLTSLNTDPKLLEDYKDAIESIIPARVKVNTLENIISYDIQKKYMDIDFISIDTEGTEFRVLTGLNMSLYRPKLLVVENNYECQHIRYLLEQYDYKLDQRYYINDFYVTKN